MTDGVRYADPNLVEQQAQVWTQAQMDCRIGNHAWDHRHTLLLHHSLGGMEVQQTCARRCGVKRRAMMNRDSGHLLTGWNLDYSEARNYLLRDEQGRSVGRLDAEGRARIRRRSWAAVRVIEVEDDG